MPFSGEQRWTSAWVTDPPPFVCPVQTPRWHSPSRHSHVEGSKGTNEAPHPRLTGGHAHAAVDTDRVRTLHTTGRPEDIDALVECTTRFG